MDASQLAVIQGLVPSYDAIIELHHVSGALVPVGRHFGGLEHKWTGLANNFSDKRCVNTRSSPLIPICSQNVRHPQSTLLSIWAGHDSRYRLFIEFDDTAT